MRAVVVGGGIGGLAAVGALRRVGWDAVVVERAATLEVVGAGIGLSANALRALDRIGAGDEVRARGASAVRIRILDESGGVITEIPLAERGWEMLGVHRADLQSVLLEAAGRDSVRVGVACTGFRAEKGRVVAELADGSEEAGDALVGADGMHSVVRERALGDGPPRFASYVGWRAVVSFDDERLRGTMSESWGRGLRFGLIPIGGGNLYWFVSETAPQPEARILPGRKDELARRVAGWHEPIAAAVAATPDEAIVGTGIYWRKPVRRWGAGRVTLLGDAAHPMTPDMSQGAAQALEDAVELAASLRGAEDVAAALRRYEARRQRRTATIVRRSRALGRMAQSANPLVIALRRALLKLPASVQARQQGAVIDYALPALEPPG